MTQRILVTGAHGQVGRELMRLTPNKLEVSGLGSTELDICDALAVDDVIERLQPCMIINAAAYTAVDKAESEPEKAYAVNATGVANLARSTAAYAIPLMHLSTDYVFPGDTRTPYREEDRPAPASIYGASKLAGEQALQALNPRHIILRTNWVFSPHGHNFVKTMLRLAHERTELSVVTDQQGGPTSAASIAKLLWQLCEHYLQQGSLPWGIYHFSGQPACDWCTFAREIFTQATTIGLIPHVPQLNGISSKDYPTPAKRPSFSVLDCSKLEMQLSTACNDWKDELATCLQTLRAECPSIS